MCVCDLNSIRDDNLGSKMAEERERKVKHSVHSRVSPLICNYTNIYTYDSGKKRKDSEAYCERDRGET